MTDKQQAVCLPHIMTPYYFSNFSNVVYIFYQVNYERCFSTSWRSRQKYLWHPIIIIIIMTWLHQIFMQCMILIHHSLHFRVHFLLHFRYILDAYIDIYKHVIAYSIQKRTQKRWNVRLAEWTKATSSSLVSLKRSGVRIPHLA